MMVDVWQPGRSQFVSEDEGQHDVADGPPVDDGDRARPRSSGAAIATVVVSIVALIVAGLGIVWSVKAIRAAEEANQIAVDTNDFSVVALATSHAVDAAERLEAAVVAGHVSREDEWFAEAMRQHAKGVDAGRRGDTSALGHLEAFWELVRQNARRHKKVVHSCSIPPTNHRRSR